MRTCLAFAAALTFLLAPAAFGQPVTVQILRTGGVVETTFHSDGEAIDLDPLPDPDSVTLIRAYSTNSNNTANIGTILLGGTRTAAGTLDILIGRAGAIDPDPTSPLSEAATNWSGIIVDSGLVNKVRLSGAILGDTTGPINAGEIVRLQCGGHITGNVEVHNTGVALGRVVARSLGANTDITAHHGSVGTLQFTSAPGTVAISGDITVQEGFIEALLASGWIGNDGVIAPQVLARDGILSLEVPVVGEGAVVRANAFDGTGPLRRVQVAFNRGTIAGHDLQQDPLDPAGIRVQEHAGLLAFAGSVHAGIIIEKAHGQSGPAPGSIRIAGNLRANISCSSSIGTIWIDGDVRCSTAGAPIQISAHDEYGVQAIESLRVGNVIDRPGDAIHDVFIRSGIIHEFRAASFTGHLEAQLVDVEITGDAGGRLILSEAHEALPCRIDIHGKYGSGSSPAYFDYMAISPYATIRIGSEVHGRIELDWSQGYYEQCIIGANVCDAEPDSHGWLFTLNRLISGQSQIRINIHEQPPDRAPYYDRLPSDLGGGSIGTVPFALHASACQPPRNQSSPPVFLNSAFGHVTPAFPGAYEPAEIVLVAYGPVRTASLTEHPVIITRDVPGSPEPPIEGYAVTLKRGDEPGSSRVMTIHGNGTLLLPGTYTIRPKRDAQAYEVLRCDRLLTSAIVPVADFEYTFVLVGDCNANGEEDEGELLAEPGKDQWPLNGVIDACEDCVADLNCDGAENAVDVEIMALAVEGDFTDFCGFDADFNHDGAVNGFDIAAVEDAVAGGPCP